MKEWWKLGLGVPSEDLGDEGEYDEGWFEKGLKEWRKSNGIASSCDDSKDFEDFEDLEYSAEAGPSKRLKLRIQQLEYWENFVRPLSYEILAIH
ncbi:hypothetical protein BOTCAL_0523g00080 [Botryotinia calthae]|uniref:Uncharacterized protein n=1 Tax=Botryotinia calthae TaxID=38488 RepID=A0A4Y8CKS8_9HELO|nr:hypothetical protein BOTCAL_0523g00080 [Botryotinia calthae]